MKGRISNLATQLVVMAIAVSVVLFFLAIGALILIHFCVARRAIRRAFSNGVVMVERNGAGNMSMSQIDIEKLPSFDFREKDVESSSGNASSPVSCAVCLENFKGGDKCRLLPICNHSFHMECVDAWLIRKPHCPICRGSANSIEMTENAVGLDTRIEETTGHTGTIQGPEDDQNDRRSPRELTL